MDGLSGVEGCEDFGGEISSAICLHWDRHWSPRARHDVCVSSMDWLGNREAVDGIGGICLECLDMSMTRQRIRKLGPMGSVL